MGSYKVDVLHQFVTYAGKLPTISQQNIMNAITSHNVVIIPSNYRCYGISTALLAYISWEMYYATEKTHIRYVTRNAMQTVYEFNQFHGNTLMGTNISNRDITVYNTTISFESMGTCFGDNYRHIRTPNDIYVIDDNVYPGDKRTHMMLNHLSKSVAEKYTSYAKTTNGYYQPWNSHTYEIGAYGVPRLVIISDNPDYLINDLVYIGYSFDDICIPEIRTKDCIRIY